MRVRLKPRGAVIAGIAVMRSDLKGAFSSARSGVVFWKPAARFEHGEAAPADDLHLCI